MRTYIAIDLKSYYASVECRERGRDALTTNLVVADPSRTEKTICLAVSPSLKAYGIPGRARLFEVVQKVQEINAQRLSEAIRLHKAVLVPDEHGATSNDAGMPANLRRQRAHYTFSGKSSDATALAADPSLELDFIIAPPRMKKYMKISSEIVGIYLKYVSMDDLVSYSIDECFIDVTDYLDTYRMTAHELARAMIRDVLETTGITATAGIAPNLFLCKVAMDITAKHIPADADGVRIAELDEMTYRRQLWDHTPLTDFWRVGPGIARKLAAKGLYTMGDIARCSIGGPQDYYNEDLLFKLLGVNAELLIDHAWGYEPTTIAQIKAYKPETNSVTNGQVLQCPYTADKARLVTREMSEMMVLGLVEKGLVTDQITLTINYDIENLSDPSRARSYHGPIVTDRYGRKVPKHAHGSMTFSRYTSSTRQITDEMMALYDRIVDRGLLIRRITMTANRLILESQAEKEPEYEQLNLFTDYAALEEERAKESKDLEKEKRMQQAMLSIQKKFGKNAILKGSSLQEGATAQMRNRQVGGHAAGEEE